MMIGNGLRVCAGCGGEIPPTRKKQAKFCSAKCKKREEKRRWREANPEKKREASRRWREANLEKDREASRRWREANLEKDREAKRRWREANLEKVREKDRRWRAENLEKAREAVRKASRRRYHIETYGREVPILEMTKDRFRAARALGYRSGLEVAVARYLEDNKVPFEYETLKLQYVIPERVKTYTPDIILPNGIILELKGEFKPADRTKMKAVKAAHPDLDIRFVFSDANKKITKGSKTTCADWAEQNGFPFANKLPPKEWFHECKDSR